MRRGIIDSLHIHLEMHKIKYFPHFLEEQEVERDEDFRLLGDHPIPPQASYLFPNYSLSTNNSHEPFESTEMLDRTDDKEEKAIIPPENKVSKKSLLSRILPHRRYKQNGNEPRVIYINQPQLNAKFMQNRVSTAKYNPISFLPKFLYVEFSKSANLFFLFISGIQVLCVYYMVHVNVS